MKIQHCFLFTLSYVPCLDGRRRGNQLYPSPIFPSSRPALPPKRFPGSSHFSSSLSLSHFSPTPGQWAASYLPTESSFPNNSRAPKVEIGEPDWYLPSRSHWKMRENLSFDKMCGYSDLCFCVFSFPVSRQLNRRACHLIPDWLSDWHTFWKYCKIANASVTPICQVTMKALPSNVCVFKAYHN